MAWEYTQIPLNDDGEPESSFSLDDLLRTFGEENWEIATSFPTKNGSVLVLKRAI